MLSEPQRFRVVPYLLIACLALSVIAGCAGPTSHSSSTSVTPTPTATKTNPYAAPPPCTSPPPDECRFWVPGVIAVAVSFSPSMAAVGGNLTQAVTTTLQRRIDKQLAPYVGTQLPPTIQIGAGAVVFIQEPHVDDATLLADIDAINGAILAPNVDGVSRGYLPVDQSTAWIVGASPDWYGVPAQAGGDHVHGSPDGPPIPTASTTTATHSTPATLGVGAATNVYVLDTGFRDASGYPAAGASALFDDLHSVWDESNP
ncbi:MAG: hypothetical protein H0X24_17230, partial [Ktedonobacterales bacterium]|nr:hypothetical protein [Ktedonobacterales bacterium]